MKLFYSPGSCSLSPHIVLEEIGLPYEAELMDGRTHKTKSGADYYLINPKGQVPALQLDGKDVLTEGAVIVQYIADQKPESKLAPPAGSMARYRLQEWLNFIATEIHKGMSPLFNATLPEDMKPIVKERLFSRFDFLNKSLDKGPYLMGEFTVADAYLFTVLNWAKRFEIDLSAWPAIKSFMDQMRQRPAVRRALAAEGLQ